MPLIILWRRLDDDCNSEEICQGVTCVLGCRSAQTCGAQQACIDNRCQDPCSSNLACGTNALCTVENHLPVCNCPQGKPRLSLCFLFKNFLFYCVLKYKTILGLSGDPSKACVQPVVKCSTNSDCTSGSTCVDGLCASSCEDSSRRDYNWKPERKILCSWCEMPSLR